MFLCVWYRGVRCNGALADNSNAVNPQKLYNLFLSNGANGIYYNL